jgi:excisionase family DNA binding protein
MPNETNLTSVDDAAHQVGLSRRTIFRMIANGELESFRRRGDRRTFVDLARLEEALTFKKQ